MGRSSRILCWVSLPGGRPLQHPITPALQFSPSGILSPRVPVFEFRCRGCGKRFSSLIGMTAEADDTRCPSCGSLEADKLVSRFARYRNEDDRIDEVADQLELMGEPDSPAAMRDMVRSMGKAMDEDVSDEMEEMLEADLEGEEPSEA